MKLMIESDRRTAGQQAAARGADAIRDAMCTRGVATIVLATGTSQLDLLATLVAEPIDWSRVSAFHLDEYIGLPGSHPASFALFMSRRFVSRLPVPPASFHFIDGQADALRECARLGALIQDQCIDVAFVGIGENAHLAFNDPPADFDTEDPYIIVDLDDACRRQQVGEGWFESIQQVPRGAITMSIRQIMKSRTIICTVPDQRKAQAVQRAVEGPVTSMVPASILQRHPNASVFLDEASASMLKHG